MANLARQLRIENRRLRRVDGLYTEAEIRRACVDFLPSTSEERLSVRQWTDRLQPRLKHNVIRRCLAEHGLLRDDGLYTEADIKLACVDMLDPTLPTVGVFQGFMTFADKRYGQIKTWARLLHVPQRKLEATLKASKALAKRALHRGEIGDYYSEVDAQSAFKVITGNDLPLAHECADLGVCIVVDGRRFAPDYIWREREDIDERALRFATQFWWRQRHELISWIPGIDLRCRLVMFFPEDEVHERCGMVEIDGYRVSPEHAQMIRDGLIEIRNGCLTPAAAATVRIE